MSFPNATDIATTTIEARTKKIADNVTKNNAGLALMEKRGNVRSVSGGSVIFEELSFAQNGNGAWYSGGDLLSVAASDVISSAQYSWKQLACAVTMLGLEGLQNSGEEQMIDLMEARIKVAESTMANLMAQGFYADGTTFGGKSLGGLGSIVTASPTSGTVGGIDRAVWSFWRNYATGSLGTQTATTIQGNMNTTWANLVRGKDHPNLIIFDNTNWSAYMASLQTLQRITNPEMASLGFTNVEFMGQPVVLDGGIGGFQAAGVGHFLNTDYLFLRPHKDRNMVPLNPNRRVPVNQDVEVAIIAWAGNMTCSGAQFQGYFQGN